MEVTLVAYGIIVGASVLAFCRYPLYNMFFGGSGRDVKSSSDDEVEEDKTRKDRSRVRKGPSANTKKKTKKADKNTNRRRRINKSAAEQKSNRSYAESKVSHRGDTACRKRRRESSAERGESKAKVQKLDPKRERLRILRVRGKRTKRLRDILAKATSSKVLWMELNMNLKNQPYSLLMGAPKLLNPNCSMWTFEGMQTASDLERHEGQRCILVDVRTQSTLLSCVPAGKAMIDDINFVTSKAFKVAREKRWEPVVLTYEIPPLSQLRMLCSLGRHIVADVEETWRGMVESIKLVDPMASRSSRVYDSRVAAVVEDQNTSFKEALCKEAMRKIYGSAVSIKRERPKWLKSPHSKFSLELDVYCSSRRVAVEYNGRQHYLFSRLTEMKDRVEKDLSKVTQTKERGVQLVVIPYIVGEKDIHRQIVLALCSP